MTTTDSHSEYIGDSNEIFSFDQENNDFGFNFDESDFVTEDTIENFFSDFIDDSLPQFDQPQESPVLYSIDHSNIVHWKPDHVIKRYHHFDFYKTKAGIWMYKIFGKKIPNKLQLLNILKSLQIPWNDNHETQYLWKKVKNSEKLSYRDICRSKKALLEYFSQVWENKLYRQSLETALLKIIQDQDRKQKK